MKCSTARKVIDEVDNSANLPYQTAGHLEGCEPCRQFAAEREQLRKLLVQPLRVSAPANFEAMVARRLAKRSAEKRPFWLAGGFYLRAAGAAAALACLILVAQVTMLKRVSQAPLSPATELADVRPIPAPQGTVGDPPGVGSDKAAPTTAPVPLVKRVNSLITHSKARSDLVKAHVDGPVTNMAMQPRALLLVRNPGSEHEIA